MREAECAEQLQGHLKDGTLVLQRGVALMADGSFEAVRDEMRAKESELADLHNAEGQLSAKNCRTPSPWWGFMTVSHAYYCHYYYYYY